MPSPNKALPCAVAFSTVTGLPSFYPSHIGGRPGWGPRAFVDVRRVLLQQNDLREPLQQIKDRLGSHDAQLNAIYDAMENLLDEKASQRKWEDRTRIGFRFNQ